MFGSKVSRLLCLLLSSLLVLSCFSLGVSAADDSSNLVDSNIVNWKKSSGVTLSTVNGVSRIYVQTVDSSSGSSVDNKFYGCYDIPNLIVGHNYSLSLHFPSVSEINNALGTSLTQSQILSSLNTGNLKVEFGIGYLDSGRLFLVDDFCSYISGPDMSSYIGKTVTFDFDYETRRSTGQVCFFIGVRTLDSDSSVRILYVSNPSLVDNDADNSEGLLSKLITFLIQQFTFVGNKVDSNGTTLSDKLSSVVQWVIDKMEEKAEATNSVIDTLQQTILQVIFEVFDSLGIDLEGWFNEQKQKIEDVKLEFLAWFDTFKPRVYEELYWERNFINPGTGAVINAPNGQNVIVSELFEVPLGTTYKIDFIRENADGAFQIYQYNTDGSYIGSYMMISSSTNEIILPEGFSYRFRLILNISKAPIQANAAVKLYADEGWLNALVRFLVYKIRGLFVPDPYYINDWSTELETFLSEHLGIVYDAGTLTSDFITKIGDLLSNHSSDKTVFTLPEIKIDLFDTPFVLWEEQSFELDFLENNAFFVMFYGLYKMILWVICIFATIKHARNTMERIVGV